MVQYRIRETRLEVARVYFVPIEFLAWNCLTIGALGWGQIQIANTNNIAIIDGYSRREWMVQLCNTMMNFYPREIEKIQGQDGVFRASAGAVAIARGVIAPQTERLSLRLCLGFKPAPSLEIATHTPLYEHLHDDMDIDAGVILNGVPVRDVGVQIFEELFAVAGGKKTKSEAQGLGEQEFAPWVLGPVL
jgi:hypothetical protein